MMEGNTILIRNGLVALPGNNNYLKKDILIEKGKIKDIKDKITIKETEEFDATGLLVFPGAIDPHVHFDEPGFTDREDFYHGTSASASGGVTTIIDMPCTSIPPVTDRKSLENKLDHIKDKAVIDYGLFGGISGFTFDNGYPQNALEIISDVMGFKTYLISGMDTFPRINHYQLEQIGKFSAENNSIILVHAEDYDYINQAQPLMQKKGNSLQFYYQSRPEISELLAVSAVVDIAKLTGGHFHIVHEATAEAIDLISKSKVTCETCPHYLCFDNNDLAKLGSSLKTAPVVKSPENKKSLWTHLINGRINFISSDHAPSQDKEKKTGSIWTDYSGIPGSPTLWPYLYSEGLASGKISLSCFLGLVSENAAKRYGFFDRKGSIEHGKDADLILIDPDSLLTISGKDLLSKGHITPFDGMKLKGRILKTMVRGIFVYDSNDGILVEKGFGSFLTP
jgi:allantoinase